MSNLHVDKFRLFKERQKARSVEPGEVKKARQDGWYDIKHYPNGFSSMDPCGCCSTEYAPGWYGKDSKGVWGIICGLDDEKIIDPVVGSVDPCLCH